jgi:hypothetical protein
MGSDPDILRLGCGIPGLERQVLESSELIVIGDVLGEPAQDHTPPVSPLGVDVIDFEHDAFATSHRRQLLPSAVRNTMVRPSTA